jgi:hypothetical protein
VGSEIETMKTIDQSQEMEKTGAPKTRWLMRLIYLQAVFLVLTYLQGTSSTLLVKEFSVTSANVVAHGVAASGFAVLTVAVGFVAALQGQRRVSTYNWALFVLTLVAGATGFGFLGNPSDANTITITNFSMMATLAVGVSVTGFSLAKVSHALAGRQRDDRSPTTVMTYLALGALSLTMIAGAGIPGPPFLYALFVVAHVGFAALTVALVLGVLAISILQGAGKSPTLELQGIAYPLLGLASVSIAGADGVMYLNSGDLSYALVMAEVAMLVYAFLIIGTGAPHHLNLRLGKRG